MHSLQSTFLFSGKVSLEPLCLVLSFREQHVEIIVVVEIAKSENVAITPHIFLFYTAVNDNLFRHPFGALIFLLHNTYVEDVVPESK